MWTSTVTTWPSTPSNVALMTDASTGNLPFVSPRQVVTATATVSGERNAGVRHLRTAPRPIALWVLPFGVSSPVGVAAALLDWATRRGYAFLPWGAGTLGG